MADPLSVAASIAGLVSLADVVFTRLVKYGKAVKNAEKDLKQLTKDVNLLGGSLDSLSRLARALDDGSFNSNCRMDYVDDCSETLLDMNRKLCKIEADSIKGRLFWPGRSNHLKGWHEDISRHQGMISTALSADTLSALLQMLSQENRQGEEILSEIRDTRSIVSRVDKESRRSKVQAFFLKCNPQENYEMSLKLRHPRTGLWLINRLPKFQHWISTPKSNLWLKGIPGAGKTVLAGSIIEAALGKSTNSVATAFFFCDYKNPITQSPETILGVLAYQLSIQNDDAYKVLVQHYDELHPKQGLPRSPDISSLKVLLHSILGMYEHVYLILDGLDECGDMTEDVIDVLVDTFDEADHVSVALLSRDEDGIRDRLSDYCVSIEVAAHKHDIMEYVTAQIQERIRVGKLSAYDPELKAEIIQGLVDGAKGMFRWVSCQLDHLKDCVSDQDCRDALLALPPTLDETYARILRRVPKTKRRLVQLALQFIAYASPKLTIRQLREALSVPERDTFLEPRQIVHLNAITKHCSSLVRESSDGQFLEFSHFSVLEFLKTSLSQDPELVGFRITEGLSHRLLAVECLRFLQLRNFHRLRFDPETEEEEIDNREKEFPFYSYAAEHWPSCARHAWDDTDMLDLAKLLFHPKKSPYFTSWTIAFAYAIDNMSIDDIIPNFVDPSFTPLHMASALSLGEICSFLVEQGADVNMKSEAGCPLQCAVQGLLFMSVNRTDFGTPLAEILGGYHGTMPTEETIKCLYRAGACLDTTSTQVYANQRLLGVAFRSTLLTGRLSVPTVLIKLGICIHEDDLKQVGWTFQKLSGQSSGSHEQRYLASLQPFIESLDQRADRSAATLRLCSLAWEAALDAELDFTFNLMAIDTRVTLTLSDLVTQAVAATKACNLQVLQKIILDPRFEAASIVDNLGDSLLHVALRQFGWNIEKNLEITRLLLSAGCDVLKSNKYGFQALHVWDWEFVEENMLWPDVANPEPYRKLMQMMTKMGANVASQCNSGRNVLHYQKLSCYHLQAILDTQPIENVREALEAVDQNGFTPLALLLRDGALQSFSILAKYLTLTPAMVASPVPILSLAVNANADEVLDVLIPLTRNWDFEPNDSPLHHVGPGATAKNIRRLKSLYPDACICRLHGKTPLESYLERCLRTSANAEIDPDVTGELSVLDYDEADTAGSSKVWELFGKYAASSENDEIVTSAGMSLLQLGYMRVFEKQSRVSGIIPVLSSFKDVQTTFGLQPISTTLVCEILRQTDRKLDIRQNPQMYHLLSAAARSLDFGLARLLLNEGVSVHRRFHCLSVLESYCRSPPEVSDTTRAKEMFDLLLEYTEKRQLNECDPRGNGLAAMHLLAQPGAEWMVEKLVRRGADPNLRAKIRLNNTALIHHLLDSRPSYALALLSSGADPTLDGPFGWDATLAAANGGFVLVLAEILASDNSKSLPRIKWDISCQISVLERNDEPDGPALSHDNYNGLHAGAQSGHIGVVNFYLDNSLIGNIDAKTSRGWTPLHFAAYRGYTGIINALCDHGANVNAQCRAGQSPLHLAAGTSRLEVAKALYEAGGKPFPDFSGCKPSFYADVSTNQQLNEWLLLIEKRDTDEIPSGDTVGLEAISGPALSTICATAISEDHIHKLELLEAKFFDFESPLKECQGCSALIYAIQLSRIEIVRWLLQHGATITQHVHCGIQGRTGLHLALEKDALAETIPDCLTNFTRNGGRPLGHSLTLINSALEGNNLQGLKLLLTYLTRIDEYNKNESIVLEDAQSLLAAVLSEFDELGITPLICAVRYENLAAIDMLLNFGADVNGTAQLSLNTPLHEAVYVGNVKVISLLIEKGSNLELRNRNGDTPLFVATGQRTFTNLHALLAADADRTVLNRFDESFLDKIAYDHPESCAIFAESLHFGVDPHRPIKSGISPFHRAINQVGYASYILNSDFHLEDSLPFNWDFFGEPAMWIDTAYRFFRKRYRIEALQTFANMTPSDHWSPLCRSASRGEIKPMENLLDLNCPLNYEGCPFGSALMAACIDGRMECVAFLVRRGASLTYQGPNGYRSAYFAARKHQEILWWLLVGRFVDEKKLESSCGYSDTRESCPPATWGGPIAVEVVISGELERWPRESSQAYWSRLLGERLSWRGKVPPLARERRTIRPSNLIPVEKVRIHPDGYDITRALRIHGNDGSTQDDKRGMRFQTTPKMVFDGLLWYTPWAA